jgi:two-component system sensor histidine kinase TctE
MVLLLVPLLLLSVLNTWFDVRSADNAALQQDRQLLGLVPLLADSVVSGSSAEQPLLLMAPAMDEFLAARPDAAAIAVLDMQGRVLAGAAWLTGLPPTTGDAEFASEEFEGTTFRIVSQRARTAAGELTLRIADGSDPRQQWLRQLWLFCLELGRTRGAAPLDGA